MTENKIPDGFTVGTFGPYSQHCGPLMYKQELSSEGNIIKGWVGLLLEEKHVGGNNRGHGGLLMTLLDEVMGMNACFHRDLQPCVTVSMQTQFFAPMEIGEFIWAEAHITHSTATLAFVEGKAWINDKLIGNANGTWKYIKRHSS